MIKYYLIGFVYVILYAIEKTGYSAIAPVLPVVKYTTIVVYASIFVAIAKNAVEHILAWLVSVAILNNPIDIDDLLDTTLEAVYIFLLMMCIMLL